MTEFVILLNQNQWLFIVISFIFAAILGSFLNVVIHRLPVMMKRQWQQECNEYLSQYHPNISKQHQQDLTDPIDEFPQRYNLAIPASSCPNCHAHIKSHQNIPIFSWFILKGRCPQCQTPISARYPFIEFISAGLIAFLAWHYGPTSQFIFSAILTLSLIVLTAIDIDEMLLPDQMTLPLLWLGIIVNLNMGFVSLHDAILGAIAGYLSLWFVYWGFKLLTNKEGMGYGDFKLLAVLGAWMGWQMLPIIILLSSVVGAAVGILMIITKQKKYSQAIPFGPYLAAAGWIAMIWGGPLLNRYLSYL
ncbi:prepilin peptidase [Shewanella surugensis]|uniref:Prepilin leader peptidase/N-methyltransferase n=1 Tax=Shewanella surugensis TaxID=212020 RepID=A0ABT0LDK5_9GAMM|nr:A24 family peptidase [Shewanella surugensis]MCL1125773.1 A24 family peptidase [Shewanella surugensis]